VGSHERQYIGIAPLDDTASIPRLEASRRIGESFLAGPSGPVGASHEDSIMLKNTFAVSLIVALPALVLAGLAQAQSSAPNLSGTYRCQPQPAPCKWQGQTLTISQTGPKLELKIDNNEAAEAKLTSDISISAGPPYNAQGLIRPDHSIEWSNGTKWLKQ
jgi:hypothetical protein